MAILQDYRYTTFRTVIGDGSSSSVTLDLTREIAIIPPTDQLPYPGRHVPKIVLSTTSGGPSISSTSLDGFKVTLNFSSAPTNGQQVDVTVQLGY